MIMKQKSISRIQLKSSFCCFNNLTVPLTLFNILKEIDYSQRNFSSSTLQSLQVLH